MLLHHHYEIVLDEQKWMLENYQVQLVISYCLLLEILKYFVKVSSNVCSIYVFFY